jgi:hypothetical protein
MILITPGGRGARMGMGVGVGVALSAEGHDVTPVAITFPRPTVAMKEISRAVSDAFFTIDTSSPSAIYAGPKTGRSPAQLSVGPAIW